MQSPIKQTILFCWGSVRLPLKSMKTLLLTSTWASIYENILHKNLCEEEETRNLQITPDKKPPQTQVEIMQAWKAHGQCLSRLRSWCTLCLNIGNWRVHWRREVQKFHINCACTWLWDIFQEHILLTLRTPHVEARHSARLLHSQCCMLPWLGAISCTFQENHWPTAAITDRLCVWGAEPDKQKGILESTRHDECRPSHRASGLKTMIQLKVVSGTAVLAPW